MSLLSGARIVTPTGVLTPGWVEIHGAKIVGLGAGIPAGPAEDLGGAWLLPGYIDLHVHGGGGYDFTGSEADMAAGVEFHLAHGTTRTLVSLVSAPVDALCEQLAWSAELVGRSDVTRGRVVGAHLEGPFLSHARCGAHNEEYLLLPDQQVVAKLLDAAGGQLRMITIAPELPGALDLIRSLAAAGVIAAVGHTDGDYDITMKAFDAGASQMTHLFNAMRQLNHREPGPVAAALESGVPFEIINDGVHIDDAMTRLVARCGPSQLLLITDAMEATGVGDGEYLLGGQTVIVRDGQARIKATGALAGSRLTMDEALRRAVFDIGLPIELASAAASTNPARVLGLSDRCGSIEPDKEADFVVLDDDLRVKRVMVQGCWI